MGVKKFVFPEDPDEVNVWKEIIGIRDPDWKPTDNTRVCAEHFCEVSD